MKKIKKCVIPAAWFGTRFLPASKALPKEMFPIIDKPVMQYLVEEAIQAGCEDIIIVTWRNKRAIEDHFDSNYELEKSLESKNKFELLERVKMLNNIANITYLRQPYARWDWDAILRAKPFIWDEPFLVLFWDDLIDSPKSWAEQLVEVFERKNSSVIASIPVKDEEVSQYWIIESNSADWNSFVVDKFLEKPEPSETKSRNWVIWKYVVTNDIFKYLQQVSDMKASGEIRLADAFELMRQQKDIYGVNIVWDRYDTWSKIGFLKATIAYWLKNDEVKEELVRYLKTLKI
jgi:UTP--glucose-1-phosphate uridylyltransferase